MPLFVLFRLFFALCSFMLLVFLVGFRGCSVPSFNSLRVLGFLGLFYLFRGRNLIKDNRWSGILKGFFVEIISLLRKKGFGLINIARNKGQ